MGTAIGTRPLRLQDMLKTAMSESAQKINVSNEAARQQSIVEEPTKTAATQTEGVDHDYCLKLASAVEMIIDTLDKHGADLAGPYNLTENKQEVGKGPGALHVMEAEASKRFPEHQGQGHHVVPMTPGLEKGLKTERAPSKLETNMEHPAGLHSTQTTAMSGGQGKTAEEKCAKCNKPMDKCACGGKTAEASPAAKIKAAFVAASATKTAAPEAEKKETEGMDEAKKGLDKAEAAHKSEPENKEGSAKPNSLVEYLLSKTGGLKKTAEDAINPAHISAGAAVPPDTSAAGEPGGAPAGGAGEGPKGLVSSNESAQHYKKNQAYAPRKAELAKYFAEPALTMSTDKTLAEAFEHTGQAGTKFASATGGSTKVAAARAVLAKLAEEAGQKNANNPKGEKGAAPAA